MQVFELWEEPEEPRENPLGPGENMHRNFVLTVTQAYDWTRYPGAVSQQCCPIHHYATQSVQAAICKSLSLWFSLLCHFVILFWFAAFTSSWDKCTLSFFSLTPLTFFLLMLRVNFFQYFLLSFSYSCNNYTENENSIQKNRPCRTHLTKSSNLPNARGKGKNRVHVTELAWGQTSSSSMNSCREQSINSQTNFVDTQRGILSFFCEKKGKVSGALWVMKNTLSNGLCATLRLTATTTACPPKKMGDF